MNQLQLRFAELVRYLCVGFCFIGVCFICEGEKISVLISKLKIGGVTLSAFVLGVIIYNLYRGPVHARFIVRLKDKLAHKKGNLRIYLNKNYPQMSRSEAELFWYFLRQELADEKRETMRNNTSGIHLLYIAGICCCIGMIYALISTGWKESVGLFVSAVVLIASALENDMRFEKLEEIYLRSFDERKIKEFVERIFTNN